MQALCKLDAYPSESLVFMGIAFDGVLAKISGGLSRLKTVSLHTAIGFASVLTNSEVTLSVRDMMG